LPEGRYGVGVPAGADLDRRAHPADCKSGRPASSTWFSVTGVTGARTTLATDLGQFVERVRSLTIKPLAVGFGISTPEQVVQVGQFADGVVVGSALINAVNEGKNPAYSAEDLSQDCALNY